MEFHEHVHMTLCSRSSEQARSSVWEQEGTALFWHIMMATGRDGDLRVDLHKTSSVARFRPKFIDTSSYKVADKTLKSTQPAYSVDKS